MPESTPPLIDPEGLSRNEKVKASSNHLRGTLAEELGTDASTFTEDATQVLKFHGVYQQDDRDRRKEARARGLDKHYQMMIRTRIPGGLVSPEGYLAHDQISGDWADGTLRVTTRQDFQLHGVLKGDLRASIRAINDALMTTLGGCGDQERNIMCCPAPVSDRFHAEVSAFLSELVPALTPTTGAYHEIWIDGVLQGTEQPQGEVEDLYGELYLPRKFKTAIALEGDNCVDAYSNDLALVVRRGPDGGLAGVDVLVGGGLGRTANKPETFPAVAKPLAFVSPEQAVATSRAIVAVQRDFGDRVNRRHARLNNPTVMIVVDRRDLKTQLSDDFDACDYPNVDKAHGVEDLKKRLQNDWRELDTVASPLAERGGNRLQLAAAGQRRVGAPLLVVAEPPPVPAGGADGVGAGGAVWPMREPASILKATRSRKMRDFIRTV